MRASTCVYERGEGRGNSEREGGREDEIDSEGRKKGKTGVEKERFY